MNTYERFKALPRARKGTTTVVIVEEEVLLKLVRDVESGGMAHPAHANSDGSLTTITGGATGGAPMQIHFDGPIVPPTTVLVEDVRRQRSFGRPGSRSARW